MIIRAVGKLPVLFGLIAAVFALPVSASAQTWDSSGANPTAPVDGSGFWDTTTSALWSNGSSDTVWSNGSTATFGGASGTPGTVTIDDPSGVSVGGINFNIGGYTIASSGSANTLILNATPTITLSGVFTDSISAFLTGTTGFNLTGNGGTLALTSANTYSGTTTINSGFLLLGNANAVQNSTVAVNSDKGLTFATGGTYNLAGLTGGNNIALSDVTGTQNVTLSIGGTATSTYTGSLSNGLSGGIGSLTKTGAGGLTLSANQTYTGATTVNGGTLTIGATLQSTSLTLGGGTLAFTAASGNPATFTSGTTINGAVFSDRLGRSPAPLLWERFHALPAVL